MSLGVICRRLGLDRTTVRRFARAASVDELLTKAVNRVSDLDRFTPHLAQRFAAGGVDAVTLYAEIQAQGYTGSVQTVRRYLRPMRALSPTPSARPVRAVVPKPRLITCWMMTDPDQLDADENPCTEPGSHSVPRAGSRRPPRAHLRRPDEQTPGRTTRRLDDRRCSRQPARTAFARHRTAPRPGRRHRRPVSDLELGRCRGHRQQDQERQEADVWPGRLLLTAQANPSQRLATTTRSSPEPNSVSDDNETGGYSCRMIVG
jgi:hypothetical protein